MWSPERNFLDHYFSSIYNKLEADALLFNRRLPHAGLIGSENENAIADVIRGFLPNGFGVEVNGLVIDRHGATSKQCDIVIYDAGQPRFFRKVFPIEIVYAVIEVKTSMSKTEADAALDNLVSVNRLDFRPDLTPYWKTRTQQEHIRHDPPRVMVFSYRTNAESFETFARWFKWEFLAEGLPLRDAAPVHPEIRTLTVCALDQGMIRMESSNGYIERFFAAAGDSSCPRTFPAALAGQTAVVDPAKSLFLFLHRLWCDLEHHKLHPGFDIRSYMSLVLGSVIVVTDEMLYPKQPTQ